MLSALDQAGILWSELVTVLAVGESSLAAIATTTHHVSIVIGLCPNVEMGGIYAAPHITAM